MMHNMKLAVSLSGALIDLTAKITSSQHENAALTQKVLDQSDAFNEKHHQLQKLQVCSFVFN